MNPLYSQEQQDILDEIKEYVRELMNPENREIKAHDWKHAFRVRSWALKIAQREGFKETFLLEIASLLHDIGRLKEKEMGQPHAQVSAIMAREYLAQKEWLPADKLEEVLYAINKHSTGGESQLVHILQDADRLDGFGAIGIVRAFHPKWYLPDYNPASIINPFTMAKTQVDEFFQAKKGVDIAPFALDHLGYMLSWYDLMNTKTGKELGAPLISFTKAFLEEFEKEAKQMEE